MEGVALARGVVQPCVVAGPSDTFSCLLDRKSLVSMVPAWPLLRPCNRWSV